MEKNPKKLKKVKSALPWGAVFKMAKDPVNFLIKHQKETGDLYRIDAPIKLIVTSNHEHIRHILQKNWRNYEKGAAYDGFKLLLGEGILVSNGEKWKKNRKLIQPSFKRDQVEKMTATMIAGSKNWAADWAIKSENNEHIEAKSDMLNFALTVLSDVILGKECSEKYSSKFLPLIHHQYDFVLKRNLSLVKIPMGIPVPSHRRFLKAKKDVDAMIYEIIESKQETKDESMLSMLMDARDDEGNGMSKEQLRDEFMTLFAAGFETTGSALVWILLLLAKHPEVQEKVYKEIKAIDEENIRDLMKSKFFNAVIKESMRLFPAAWVVSRKSVAKDIVDGHIIPKNSTIFVSIFNLHRDPNFWEDPHTFKPERFLEENDNPSYFPYGVGPRMCVGNHFSQTQILTGLFQLLTSFKIELGVDRGYEADPKISLKPLGDVMLKLTPRNEDL